MTLIILSFALDFQVKQMPIKYKDLLTAKFAQEEEKVSIGLKKEETK